MFRRGSWYCDGELENERKEKLADSWLNENLDIREVQQDDSSWRWIVTLKGYPGIYTMDGFNGIGNTKREALEHLFRILMLKA